MSSNLISLGSSPSRSAEYSLMRVDQVDPEGLISLTERGALPRPSSKNTLHSDSVMAAQQTFNLPVPGSSPGGPTKYGVW